MLDSIRKKFTIAIRHQKNQEHFNKKRMKCIESDAELQKDFPSMQKNQNFKCHIQVFIDESPQALLYESKEEIRERLLRLSKIIQQKGQFYAGIMIKSGILDNLLEFIRFPREEDYFLQIQVLQLLSDLSNSDQDIDLLMECGVMNKLLAFLRCEHIELIFMTIQNIIYDKKDHLSNFLELGGHQILINNKLVQFCKQLDFTQDKIEKLFISLLEFVSVFTEYKNLNDQYKLFDFYQLIEFSLFSNNKQILEYALYCLNNLISPQMFLSDQETKTILNQLYLIQQKNILFRKEKLILTQSFKTILYQNKSQLNENSLLMNFLLYEIQHCLPNNFNQQKIIVQIFKVMIKKEEQFLTSEMLKKDNNLVLQLFTFYQSCNEKLQNQILKSFQQIIRQKPINEIISLMEQDFAFILAFTIAKSQEISTFFLTMQIISELLDFGQQGLFPYFNQNPMIIKFLEQNLDCEIESKYNLIQNQDPHMFQLVQNILNYLKYL